MKSKKHYSDSELFEIQSECAWSVIAVNNDLGDDAEIQWYAIQHHMAAPHNRVIGIASEEEGPRGAIIDAIDNQDKDAHKYYFDYKG